MRIGVDGRDLTDQAASGLRQPRGIARYASSLLQALVEGYPEHDWVVALPAGAPAPALRGIEIRRQRLPRRLVGLGAVTTGRPRMDRLLAGPDVLWLPAPVPVAVTPGARYVLTVHDLSTELRPGDLRPYPRLWSRLTRARRLARQASAVIVDSDATRRDALTHWGLAPERVALVRPGVWHPPTGGAPPAGVPADYLLYVGALEPRKGVDVLVDAYARARAEGLSSALVVVGDGPLGPALDAPGVVRTGRVDDVELAALYAGARATVLPSHMEGFGFTPLESLAAGTPVVVSDLPPLRETLGDAAVFVPAGDRDALAGAMTAIATDAALRERVMAAAPAALAPLSWSRAADQAMELLAEAAKGMNQAPPFSAVVVTHNSAAELAVLLDSIATHLDPPPEIIVVDTGSADDSAAVARGRARTIELGDNPGFGAASNIGVGEATAPVTVLLNPDVILLDDALGALARDAAASGALLIPRLLNRDGSIQDSAHPLPGTVRALLPALVHPRVLPRGLRLDADPWRSDRPRRVGWAIAACLAAPTPVLRELGPFDAAQFLFYEDMDLCLAARGRGYPTELRPDLALVHTGGHSTSRRYGGEPLELLARRRRQVVGRRLGRRALLLDDVAQGATFTTRWLARTAVRRDGRRPRAQLAALRRARRIRDIDVASA